MGRLLYVLLFACAACGRLGFDALPSSATDAPPTGSAALSYPTDDLDAVLGDTQVTLTPTFTGTPRFAIAPSLPTGLSLDATTGVIAGIPTQARDTTAYTISTFDSDDVLLSTFALTLTVLPGWVTDVGADGSDDNNGVDATCFSSVAGGCSLQAAIQTATMHLGPTRQLILLGARTYTVSSNVVTDGADLLIAGLGPSQTIVRPQTPNPGYRFTMFASTRSLELKKVAFDLFGPADGAVIAATNGSFHVDRCSFTGNKSAGSGGVFNFQGATAILERSTFTRNTSYTGNGWGGVIDGEGANTQITVVGCTAIENEAPWGSFSHITTGTTLRLESSTLYNNTSTIAGTLATPGGIYTLVNDTIVNNRNTNTTPDSAAIYLYSAPCHYTISNTIVAFNTDVASAQHNCNRRDLSTSITSNGGNIISDGAENCATYFSATGDRLSTDPQLELVAPADHGGPTATILPTPTSLVLGAGQACPATDQRGLPRPATGCDAGAVELP